MAEKGTTETGSAAAVTNDEIAESLIKRSGMSRRDFLKLMAAEGFTAVLSACGVETGKPGEIPKVKLSELVASPDLYMKFQELSVSGYLQELDKTSISMPLPIKAGDATIWYWETMETKTYKLHETPDVKSPGITLVERGSSFYPGAPFEPLPNRMSDKPFEVIGSIQKIKDKEGAEMYALIPRSITEANPETPTK